MPKHFSIQRSYLAMTALFTVLASSQAHSQVAQTPEANAGKTPTIKPAVTSQLETVVVSSSADRDDRRQSTATKIVVTRDDLTRFGDSTVAEVLNRVSGITVSGTAGRDAEIKMRGLGNGYTQILLNGEPVAPGFSLDSLSPNLIERIEVMRSATADQSAQAIAGTINIILKQVVRTGQRELKLTQASERDRPSTTLDGQLSDRDGSVSYTLASSLRIQDNVYPAHIRQEGRDAQGQTTSVRLIDRREHYEGYSASLTPRLTWTASERDKVVADGFLLYQHMDIAGRDVRTVQFGPPPLYGDNDIQAQIDTGTLRGRLSWTRNLANNATFELKLGGNYNRRTGDTHRRSVLPGQDFDNAGSLALERFISSVATDNGLMLNGKYRAPYLDNHTVALGWDGESARRSDSRLQRTTISTVEPWENLDQVAVAQVRRLAFFAQDEWDISPQWSTYLGLRWETLETTSSSNTLAAVNNRSSVLSPILQSLWKVPETAGDQVRLALSRTYKAPATRDLIARRYRNYDNGPTSPDTEGNPNLRPELAWGLDLTYERHLDNAGSLLSANLFARQIHDVILQELYTDAIGRWVLTPVNKGDAQVHGIELEAKGNLRKLFAAAPAVDVRLNFARNWSTLSAVPGPNNRLSSQIPLSANLGADWRPDGLPLTLGGNYGYQHGGWIRLAENQRVSSSAKRTLDFYGLWKASPTTQLRLTLSNLLHQAAVQENIYSYSSGTLDQTTTSPTATVVRLMLEMKL